MFVRRVWQVSPGVRHASSAVAPVVEPLTYQPSIWQKLFASSTMPRVPLTEPFPSTPALQEPLSFPNPRASISKLESGLRIVSLESNSPIAHIGVFIDAGSRHETPEVSGISHFLEFLAFRSTTHRSDFKLVREIGKIGANVTCTAAREHVMYAADVLREHVPNVVDILTDVLQNQKFADDELTEARAQYKHFIDSRLQNGDVIIQEAIHEAAFSGATLGMPFYATADSLEHFTKDLLHEWVRTFYVAPRVVVSAVGVSHDHLESFGKQQFGTLKKDSAYTAQPARYTGGEARIHRRSGKGTEFTHVSVAWEAGSWHSKDLIPLFVLQTLMGGGGSFSAGGPGKGMYSRLYQNILNAHDWVESAQSLLSVYTDSGFFGLHGKVRPENAKALVTVLVEEAQKMAVVHDAELSRAKKALKGNLFHQLESLSVQLEDLGRQAVTYGKVFPAQELAQQIDAVTTEDIRRVASRLLQTPLSVAAYGDVSRLPRYDEIRKLTS